MERFTTEIEPRHQTQYFCYGLALKIFTHRSKINWATSPIALENSATFAQYAQEQNARLLMKEAICLHHEPQSVDPLQRELEIIPPKSPSKVYILTQQLSCFALSSFGDTVVGYRREGP